MSRKKGFKVKRSRRNLYKKRKSTGRKIFDGVLFVVILGAFVFVGYATRNIGQQFTDQLVRQLRRQ